MQSAFESAAKKLGISSGDMATINGQIRDAVSGLDLSASADPKATIEQTVDATLRDNGVDPQEFKSEVRIAMRASGAGGDSDGDGDDGGAVISDFLKQSRPGTFVDVTA